MMTQKEIADRIRQQVRRRMINGIFTPSRREELFDHVTAAIVIPPEFAAGDLRAIIGEEVDAVAEFILMRGKAAVR